MFKKLTELLVQADVLFLVFINKDTWGYFWWLLTNKLFFINLEKNYSFYLILKPSTKS